MFDPEKVERWTCEGSMAYMESGENKAINSRREYVIATDYDQLLELYRGLLRQWNQGLRDSQHAADMNYGMRDPLGRS